MSKLRAWTGLALMAGAMLAAVPLQAQSLLRVAPETLSRVLDPHFTTSFTTRDLGYLIYDTLFAVEGKDHNELKARLREQAINVTVSTQFSSRLDLKGRGLVNVMRASVHVYNTEDELDRFVAALEAIV